VVETVGLRYVIVSLLLTALAASTYFFLLSPQGRQLIDSVQINLRRAENLVRHRAGKALRGTPELARLEARLAEKGVAPGVPVHIRIYKLESKLELWTEKNGRFELFATYPICMWRGRLGPKLREGDGQAPEGFYTVAKDALNPNSKYHLSFNLGFPNAYDRSKGRTGSHLMVHGGCGSIGCYAVTDRVMDEIWQLVTVALDNGQRRIPVHVFPFHMTDRNMRLRKGGEWSDFWSNLKNGYDLFEQIGVPPVVSVCEGRYVFEAGSSATVSDAVKEGCPPGIADNS